jgi:hypothetical protein
MIEMALPFRRIMRLAAELRLRFFAHIRKFRTFIGESGAGGAFPDDKHDLGSLPHDAPDPAR